MLAGRLNKVTELFYKFGTYLRQHGVNLENLDESALTRRVQEVMGVQIALQTLEADRTLDKVEYLQELLRSTPMGDPEGARLLSEYEVAFQDVVQKLNQAGEMFEKVFHLRCHDLPGMGRLRRLATAYARGVARAASFSA
jgi:hypothetical protein